MYLFVEQCVLLVYQMYMFDRRKTNATMSTHCVKMGRHQGAIIQ